MHWHAHCRPKEGEHDPSVPIQQVYIVRHEHVQTLGHGLVLDVDRIELNQAYAAFTRLLRNLFFVTVPAAGHCATNRCPPRMALALVDEHSVLDCRGVDLRHVS